MASWGLTVQKGPWRETPRDRRMAIRGANRHDPYSPRNTYNAPAVKASIDVIADIPYTPIAAIPEYYYNLLVPMSFIEKQNQGSVTDANPIIDETVDVPKTILNPSSYEPSESYGSSRRSSNFSITTQEADDILLEEYPFLRTIKEEDIPKVVDMERAYLQGIKLQAHSYAQTEELGREITEDLKLVYNDILESIAAVEEAAHGGPFKKEMSTQMELFDQNDMSTQTPKIPTRIMPGKRNQPHARRMETGVQTHGALTLETGMQTASHQTMEHESQTDIASSKSKKVGTVKGKERETAVQTLKTASENKQTQMSSPDPGAAQMAEAFEQIVDLKRKFDYAVEKYQEAHNNEMELRSALENTTAAGNELLRQRDLIAEESERRRSEVLVLRERVDYLMHEVDATVSEYLRAVSVRDNLIEELGALVRERERVVQGTSTMNYALAQDIETHRLQIHQYTEHITQLQDQVIQLRDRILGMPPAYDIVNMEAPANIDHDAPMQIEYQQEQLADQADIAEIIEAGGVVPRRRPPSRELEHAYVKRERPEGRQEPPFLLERERLQRPTHRNYRSPLDLPISSIQNLGDRNRGIRLQEFAEQGRQESLQRRFPPGPRGGSTIPKTKSRQKPKVPPKSTKPGGGGRNLRNIPGNPYRGPI